MVERGGLENRCARKGAGGSNPSSSASLRQGFRLCQGYGGQVGWQAMQ